MAEYIEKTSFIEHLKKDPLFDLVEQYGITGVIESFPAADVQTVKWIPVTERLPKKVGWYLVVVLAPFKQVRMYEFYPIHNNYGNDLWRNNDGDHVSNWFVTHWMPLPEPPKDGEEDV